MTEYTSHDSHIAIWPDDTWCYIGDIEEYTNKSDDYAIVPVEDNVDEMDLDDFVIHYNKGLYYYE